MPPRPSRRRLRSPTVRSDLHGVDTRSREPAQPRRHRRTSMLPSRRDSSAVRATTTDTAAMGTDTISGGPDADTIDSAGPGSRHGALRRRRHGGSDSDDNVSGAASSRGRPTSAGGRRRPHQRQFTHLLVHPVDPELAGFECMVDPIDDGPFGCGSPFTETTRASRRPLPLPGAGYRRHRARDRGPTKSSPSTRPRRR